MTGKTEKKGLKNRTKGEHVPPNSMGEQSFIVQKVLGGVRTTVRRSLINLGTKKKKMKKKKEKKKFLLIIFFPVVVSI